MQRRIVDLPEPYAPITHTTSPLRTEAVKPRMTWFGPKLLCTSLSSIMRAAHLRPKRFSSQLTKKMSGMLMQR